MSQIVPVQGEVSAVWCRGLGLGCSAMQCGVRWGRGGEGVVEGTMEGMEKDERDGWNEDEGVQCQSENHMEYV